jgi:truncated hemoglobin YjbI
MLAPLQNRKQNPTVLQQWRRFFFFLARFLASVKFYSTSRFVQPIAEIIDV